MKFPSPNNSGKAKSPASRSFGRLPKPQKDQRPSNDQSLILQTQAAILAPEGLLASKAAFSPIITPKKAPRKLPGESVWRTPNSKNAGSMDKRSLEIESPENPFP